MTNITYTAPRTVGEFMLSDSFIRLIIGPLGSGKTTGIIMEILRRSIEQAPGPDGIRRTRWVIVRQTLSQLRMTILLDLLTWLRAITSYRVSEQLVIIEFNDVRAEIYLIPLEEEEDQKRLLSMQLTGAAINEFIEISPDLVAAIAGRVGRYPSKADGGPTWFGIIGDSNAPVIGSDWWKMLEETRPPEWALFWQPGGLEPDAENIENLPDRYYIRLAANPNNDWVNRYVHAQYGEDPSGTAVFRESFKFSFHVRRNVEPVRGQILIIGQDFGRHPCSLICQGDHAGRLLVLEEVIGEEIGLETQVTRNLKPRLFQDRYMGLLYAAVGDPSGVARDTIGEEDHFEVLRRLGVPAFPAPTNDIGRRLNAVEALLYQHREGTAALVIDADRCPMLVRALNGAYRYGKTKDGQTKPLPEKTHPWSDLADCLEYVSMSMNAGRLQAIARRIRPRREKRPASRVSAAGWT